MDGNDIEAILRELENITRELDDVQKEIARDIADRVSSIQDIIEPPAKREVVIEKGFARITLRENGRTVYESLF